MWTRERRCAGCGYDLRDLPAGACPECGRSFDPKRRSTFATDTFQLPPWLRVLQLLCCGYPVIGAVVAAMLGLLHRGWNGRWLQPDDPPPVFFDVLQPIFLSCMMLPISALLAMAVTVYEDAHECDRRQLRWLWCLPLGWVVAGVLVAVDVGGFWNWYEWLD